MIRATLAVATVFVLVYPNSALCEEYDYGDKMLRWVREDAFRQSAQLAKSDHAARDLNGILMTIQGGGKVVSEIDDVLSTVASATDASETSAEKLGAVEAAFIRRADSAKNIDRLLATAGRLQMSKANFAYTEKPLGRDEFASLGLLAVGRQTLMESFVTVSNSLKPSLPEAYYEVTYTYNQGKESGSGKISGRAAPAFTVGVALTKTGNPYAAAAGVALMFGSWISTVGDNQEMRKKIDLQNRLLNQAIQELDGVLPNDEALYNIYLDAVKGHRKSIAPQLLDFGETLGEADRAWRQAMALQMARARQAGSILTAERLKQIVQSEKHPAKRLVDTALTIRLGEEMAEFSAKTAHELDIALLGCGDARSARALEEVADTVYEGKYIFRAMLQEPKIAELHESIRVISGQFNHVGSQMKSLSLSTLRRHCAAPGIAESFSENPAVTRTLRSLRRVSLPNVHAQKPLLLAQNYEVLYDLTTNSLGGGNMSCAIYRSASGLRCGAGSPADRPYDDSFNSGARDPASDILMGRRDGGFVTDQRVLGDRADAGKQNADHRIADLDRKYTDLIKFVPEWGSKKSADLALTKSALVVTLSKHKDSFQAFSRSHDSELGDYSRQMTRFASSPLDLNTAAVSAADVTGVTASFPAIDLPRVRSEGPHMPSLNPRHGTADLRTDVHRESVIQARTQQIIRTRVDENLRTGRRDPVFRSISEVEANGQLANRYLSYADKLSDRTGSAYLRFGAAADRAARSFLAESTLLRRYAEGVVISAPPARLYVGDWPFSIGKARDTLARFVSCTSEHGDNPDLAATPCNIFTYHVLSSFYGLDEAEFRIGRNPMLANQLADYVASSPNWKQIGTLRNQNNIDEAALAAIQGHAVIGVYRNPEGHGHVFTVLPGTPTYVETRPGYANAWGNLRQPQIANFALDGCSSTPERCYIDGPVSQGVRFRSEQLVSSIILWVRRYP